MCYMSYSGMVWYGTEAACAEWLLMEEGLEFQGQPASVMPELSFDALVKRTGVYYGIV